MTRDRYQHSFDTHICINFESEIENFDEAFDAWISSFPDSAARRAALLNSDESTKTLIRGVSWKQTDFIS
ncbi:MAG: hypothetical protein VKI63_04235 [Cyanobium sp.]|nr:hypothetical protein [Cyanobium sp.]